jgi:LysM repeat protein
MHRDQKIGLALGILLVGAVAAFFFRHEESPLEPLPVLQTSQALDQRIAERDRRPYLHTGDAETPSPADRPPTDEPAQPGGLVPEPIPLGPEDPDWGAASFTRPTPAPQPPTYHVVQRGETLSSIAERHLGSAARFPELFDANADRLRDANDLRVGMELRIPPRSAAAAPRTAVREDRGVLRDGDATPMPVDGANSPLRFEPYRRSPLTPQGTDAQSSSIDPKDAARRKLTQLPPRDGVSPPR